MATSLIARSLFWFKSRMEFAFWDCGDIQALVAVQSGEFCIVHGNGAAERFRGGPWAFREGLLHRSAETVRPADLFKWDVESGGDMALSLTHRETGVTKPLSVAQNMFEGKVLQLSLPHGASSNDTALSHFETEAYWATAPTVLADGEPMNLWVSLVSVMKFLYPHVEHPAKKQMRSFDSWENILEKHGLDPQHAQRSTRSKDRRTRDAGGFELSSTDAMAAMDWRISVPGLTALLTCFSISGRYQKEMGDTGKSRLRALLQGLVDYVVSPKGGSYVLGGGEAAVPIFNGNVILDVLISDQATEGVPFRSRTLLSM